MNGFLGGLVVFGLWLRYDLPTREFRRRARLEGFGAPPLLSKADFTYRFVALRHLPLLPRGDCVSRDKSFDGFSGNANGPTTIHAGKLAPNKPCPHGSGF